MDTNSYSTDRLIRLAFDYRLITDYRMTPERIELYDATSTFAFDPEEARFFLRGLIRGYEEHSRQKNCAGDRASRPAAAA